MLGVSRQAGELQPDDLERRTSRFKAQTVYPTPFFVCLRRTCSCRKRTRDHLTSPLNSLLQQRGFRLACSQSHTYSKWVQASHTVRDRLWVSGWNGLLCKTDWGDAHKIVRQITRRDTCISSSTLPRQVILCQQAILRYALLWCTKSEAGHGNKRFFGQLVWLQSINRRQWRGVDSLCVKQEILESFQMFFF